jgi:hypothetical protein
LSSNPHPSYSTTEEVIFLVIIYQYFTFFVPSFFMCLKILICIGLWCFSKLWVIEAVQSKGPQVFLHVVDCLDKARLCNVVGFSIKLANVQENEVSCFPLLPARKILLNL